jgi:gliding motility-associated-like protein
MDDFFYHCTIMQGEIIAQDKSENTITTGTMKIVLLLLFFTAFSRISAQLSSPDKVSSFIAEYASSPETDSVFVFNRPVFNGINTITLRATSTDSTSGWGFIWSVYNEKTRKYDIIPKADVGLSSVIDTISVSSGYRIIMTKGPESDTFRVWILFNDFTVMVINKDDSGTVLSGDRNCKSVTLIADTLVFPLVYTEPGTNNRYDTVDKYHFRWKADNDLSEDPSGTGFIGRIYSPPFRDTWYTVTVSDDFGLSRIDSVFCPAIASKAYMTAQHVSLWDSLEYPGKSYHYYYNEEDKSAPGKFRFDLSGSENSIWHKIDFGDSLVFETESDTVKIVHEYERPKKYTAMLLTQSPEPYSCRDSFILENSIELDIAKFDVIPNVFTPNGDFHNDLAKIYDLEGTDKNNAFRSFDVSIYTIDITIFNRIGNKVHQYSGNIRDWEGWDGNVMGSNREAPDGVYFYTITLHYIGTDEKDPALHDIEETHKGFIHLYREN